MKKAGWSFLLILVFSFLSLSAFAKDPKKFPIKPVVKSKDAKKAPSKSWDEQDFGDKEEGRDVAADKVPSSSGKNDDKAEHWDYKED